MDKAVVLGAPKNFICLLLGDETVFAALGEADGIVVQVEAHILFQMAAALAHQTAGPAAGAGADGDRPRFFDERG